MKRLPILFLFINAAAKLYKLQWRAAKFTSADWWRLATIRPKTGYRPIEHIRISAMFGEQFAKSNVIRGLDITQLERLTRREKFPAAQFPCKFGCGDGTWHFEPLS